MDVGDFDVSVTFCQPKPFPVFPGFPTVPIVVFAVAPLPAKRYVLENTGETAEKIGLPLA